MMEQEILITIAGSAALVLITILQIWAMSRAKHRHQREMAALEKALHAGADPGPIAASHQRRCNSLFCNVGHLLQIILGVLVFIAFGCWAVYLVSIGYLQWAPLAGSLALIGLMTPIIAWRSVRHGQEALAKAAQDAKADRQYPHREIPTTVAGHGSFDTAEPLTASSNAAEAVAPFAGDAAVIEDFSASPTGLESLTGADPAFADSAFNETASEPAAFAAAAEADEAIAVIGSEPAAPAEPFAAAQTPYAAPMARPAFYIEKRKLPEDSVLRRHFLQHLLTRMETLYPPPTDSILRRHYHQLAGIRMADYIEGPPPVSESVDKPVAAPMPAGAAAKTAEPSVQVQPAGASETWPTWPAIPEDSILRRHFLTQLVSEIEVSFPPPPTDSILKRHYRTLLATETEKRLAAMAR